ncbi:MAG: Ig domain-containing protein [Dissulfuribacterales bacterium]
MTRSSICFSQKQKRRGKLMNRTRQVHKRSNGFTLIEMAIVLVILGLLLGLGASLIGPLTKRAKLIENRETVKTIYEAIRGYAAQNKQLPATLAALGVKTTDAFGNSIDYYLWTGNNLCTGTGTYLTVNDSSSGTLITKNNVAFILIAMGENRCNQTGKTTPFNILPQGQQINPGTCPAGDDYDDIVMYSDIDTLREQICNTFRITTDSLPSGMEEQAYSTTVLQATDGTLPYTWTVTSGSLPSGLTLSNLTSGTCGTITCTAASPCGCISGTPSQAGSFSFTLQVTDSDTPSRTATKGMAITINPNQPVITTEFLPQATEEQAYNVSLTATGGKAPYTWSCSSSPALPGGISILGNTIAGTPHSDGNYNIRCTVTDSGSPARTSQAKTLALTILPNKPRITTEFLPLGTANQAYPFTTLSVTGGSGGYTWAMSGSLPTGLSFNPSNATISGTPTSEGTYSVTFTVTDSSGDFYSKTLSVTVYPQGWNNSSSTSSTSSTSTSSSSGGVCPALNLNPTSTTWSVTYGQSFNQTITVLGGISPYINTQCTPSTCKGLTLSCNANGATISGTPNASGTCTFNAAWHDSCPNPSNQTVSGTYTINITCPPFCGWQSNLPIATNCQPYNGFTTINGGVSPYSWQLTSGSLPPGINFCTGNTDNTCELTSTQVLGPPKLIASKKALQMPAAKQQHKTSA